MNAFTSLPDRFPWSAQDLADAMPRRLSELFAFDSATNHAPSPARRSERRSFLPAAQPALFRVHG
jgi:hypothetical protein